MTVQVRIERLCVDHARKSGDKRHQKSRRKRDINQFTYYLFSHRQPHITHHLSYYPTPFCQILLFFIILIFFFFLSPFLFYSRIQPSANRIILPITLSFFPYSPCLQPLLPPLRILPPPRLPALLCPPLELLPHFRDPPVD